MDENGYKEIPSDMSRFNSILRTDFGPFYFDPLSETKPAARERIRDEFLAELETFLDFAISTLGDWQGYLRKGQTEGSQALRMVRTSYSWRFDYRRGR